MIEICGFGILLLTALYTRASWLSHPNCIIFDEVHYGSVCSLYNQHQFHLDEQPPLGRMILCKLLPKGLSQQSAWSHIGEEFPPMFSSLHIRGFPALFGALLVPVIYIFVWILTKSHFAGFVSGILVAFDNGMIVQSRMMASDSFYITNQVFAIALALHGSPLCRSISPFIMGFALSTNWISVNSWIVTISLSLHYAWITCTQSHQSLLLCLAKGAFHVFWAISVPLLIHVLVVYIHLQQVSANGPHAFLMSSAFQASLSGGIKSTCGPVKFGSSLRLRARDDLLSSGFCYLSSSRRPDDDDPWDGTLCGPATTHSSYWKVLHPRDASSQDNVRNGDIVWIAHRNTGAFLHPVDYAAPLSQHHRAVSCTADKPLDDARERAWRVELVGQADDSANWMNLHSHVRLKHISSGSYLVSTGKKLPSIDSDGFEVVAKEQEWFDDHLSTWNAEVLDQALSGCEKRATRMSEWKRVFEFMIASLRISSEDCGDHRFSSSVFDWPLARASIGYWRKKRLKAQLHFTGNVVSWCGGVVSLCLLLLYWLVLSFTRKRRIYIPSCDEWSKLQRSLSVTGGAWVLHIICFTSRTRPCGFIYEYLSAVVFLHAAQGCFFDVLLRHRPFIANFIISIYLLAVIKCYYHLRPITYGFSNVTSLDDARSEEQDLTQSKVSTSGATDSIQQQQLLFSPVFPFSLKSHVEHDQLAV